MIKALGHFRTITTHKLKVMKGCFAVGLFKQGLLHDMSKYSPTEFLVGCRYYQGTRSPNNAERDATGYSMAWLHHKGRNKHHFEYWIDYGIDKEKGIHGQEMPTRYVVEMLMDRIAACKVYMGEAYNQRSALEYYLRGREKMGLMIHPNTDKLLLSMLEYLAENGEEATYKFVRTEILGKRK